MFCFQVVAVIYQAQLLVPALVTTRQETAHVVGPMVTVEELVVNVMTALVAGIGPLVTGCVTVSSFHIYTIFFLQEDLMSKMVCI